MLAQPVEVGDFAMIFLAFSGLLGRPRHLPVSGEARFGEEPYGL